MNRDKVSTGIKKKNAGDRHHVIDEYRSHLLLFYENIEVIMRQRE